MDRKTVIRGVALAGAGISASVFAASMFLQPAQPNSGTAMRAAEPDTVMQASLLPGGGAAPMASAELSFEDPIPEQALAPGQMTEAEAELYFSGMDPFGADDEAMEMAAAPDELDPAPPVESASSLPRLASAPTPQAENCDVVLQAEPFIDALIDVMVHAPCQAGQKAMIMHAEMLFTVTLSDLGQYSGYVPAMTPDVQIAVQLTDGSTLQKELFMPDANDYHRVALQWAGDLGVGLHGYQNGAGYGDSGHIHATNPFDPEVEGAFVVRLGNTQGNDRITSEVHSVPLDAAGQARLEVEISHDARSCGSDITLGVLQASAYAERRQNMLSVAMGECHDADGIVVLPIRLDVLQDAPMHMSMNAQ